MPFKLYVDPKLGNVFSEVENEVIRDGTRG